MGLAVLFLLLIALALLRWQAPMIAVSALGLPLVFLLYLYEADIHRDLTLRSLVPTAVLGVGLGVGWAWRLARWSPTSTMCRSATGVEEAGAGRGRRGPGRRARSSCWYPRW